LKAQVLKMSEEGTVQYSQYCYRECKPYDLNPGSECWPITRPEAAEASTPDRNGKDVVYTPVSMMPPTAPPPLAPPLGIPTVDDPAMEILPAPAPPTAAQAVINEASSASHSATEAGATIGAAAGEAEKWAKMAEKNALKARDIMKAWNERNPFQPGGNALLLSRQAKFRDRFNSTLSAGFQH